MVETETCAVMNGVKNANSSNSSPGFGSGNSGGSDIKYPANCNSRFGSSIPGLGFGMSGDSTCGGGGGGGDDAEKIYSPKRNKKIVRIVTVLGYIFSVSTVAILLSLYYLFLWDPYIKAMKSVTTQKPIPFTLTNTTFILADDDSAIFVDDRSSSSLVNSDISTNAVYETSQINNNDMSTIQNPFIANNNNKAQKSANIGGSKNSGGHGKNSGHSPTCKQCSA